MRSYALYFLVLLATVGPAAAYADGADAAETLARTLYYEGPPAAAARALDAAGIARLGEMLDEPEETDHHGNIVTILGLSEHSDAFALLRAYAEVAPSGEVDRAIFRARSRLGIAFGRLARRDPRALGWLLAEAGRTRDAGWSHRHHRGAQLRALLEEQTLTGLALSGAPAARGVLDAAASMPGDDPPAERRRRHAGHARELHARVAAGEEADTETSAGGSR